jgi:hypothetical protein
MVEAGCLGTNPLEKARDDYQFITRILKNSSGEIHIFLKSKQVVHIVTTGPVTTKPDAFRVCVCIH